MYSSLSNTGSLNSPVLGNPGAFVLTNDETEIVLQFLPKKPAHSAHLIGLIHEHGLVSPLNRGTFYASQNFLGELRGVALVGHATVIEPTNKESLKDLAEDAGNCNSKHLIMCEEPWAEQFWKYHGTRDQAKGCERRELLLELRWPTGHSNKNRPQLQLATRNDPELAITQLFNNTERRYRQSLKLCSDLEYLRNLVQEFMEGRTTTGELNSGLETFRRDSLEFLMYSDWPQFESFCERISVSAEATSGLAEVLHQFLCYLETLMGQVKMRAVLADESNPTPNHLSPDMRHTPMKHCLCSKRTPLGVGLLLCRSRR